MIRKIIKSFLGFILFLATLIGINACQHQERNFYDRTSMALAPTPTKHEEAVVQVYAARAARWRGYFAVHCWLAFKEKGARQYQVAQVIGWRLYRGHSTIVHGPDLPDRKWFGADADLLHDLRGKSAEQAIPKIRKAIGSYPYAMRYKAWPGPNSNTFVSHIIREVPELTVELPPHAIGKDWLPGGIADTSESGSGIQLSLFGVAGIVLGWAEGIELNLLGLTFGVDIRDPAIKLPLVGRLGFDDTPL